MIKGSELTNRAEAGYVAQPPKIRRGSVEDDTASAELAALRAGIEAARTLRPDPGEAIHCAHCWGQGRIAAIRVIAGKP